MPSPELTVRALVALACAVLAAAPAVGAQTPPLPVPVAPLPRATAVGDTVAAVTSDSALLPAPPSSRPNRRLTVHGYLTQGYAGLHGAAQFYGIHDRASADFRYAALQGRYALTTTDDLVLQLNHRRLGQSPISDMERAVDVNWAFYQHTFRDGTVLKAGRSPIPRGIYNQLRSVGVALPTYRPPVVFYDEGAYYSETIDGLIASRTFFEEGAWSVDAHAYAGTWEMLNYDTWSDVYSVTRARARGAVGAQLWLNTPIEGVRVGAAAQRYAIRTPDSDPYQSREYHLSLDATRERGFVRVEAQLQNYGSDELYSGYAQLGARLVGKLHGIVEVQRAYDTDVTYGDGNLPSDYLWHRSDGLGLSYVFAPTLVLKVEHHWDRGVQLEQRSNAYDPPRFRYVIASISASF